jgi:hypothetical protein
MQRPSRFSTLQKWLLFLLSIPALLFGGCQVMRLIDQVSLANYRAERRAIEKNCLLEQGLRGDSGLPFSPDAFSQSTSCSM